METHHRLEHKGSRRWRPESEALLVKAVSLRSQVLTIEPDLEKLQIQPLKQQRHR